MEQQDLLQDLEQEIYLEKASHGARFVNYVIDMIAFYIVIYIGAVFYAVLFMSGRVSSGESLSYQEDRTVTTLLTYVVVYASIVCFYTILEGATKGRTLGKLITGTRAMTTEGGPITWKDALIRSLCRIVPFEVLSGFGNPWHDTWSNTMVVKIRK